jgi:chaperonin cofactor prefoldin
MNKKDFKNPLIQSGAILLLVFLLISIVAGSGSQGVLSSIGALISGIFSTVIFIIGLGIAIVVSIAVLVGVYLAAVYFYSADKGRNLVDQLKAALCSLYSKVKGTQVKASFTAPKTSESEPEAKAAAAATQSVEPAPVKQSPATQAAAEPPAYNWTILESKIDSLDSRLGELAQSSSANSEWISSLQKRLDELSVDAAGEEKLAAVEETHQKLSEQLQAIGTEVEASSAHIQKLEQQFGEDLNGLKEELAALHDKTSVPEVISGILSYIDSAEDRDKITDKAKEAIARGMTYAQIDDFFKASLSAEVYQELAAHPRLTKDFLRSIKKKF